MTSPSTRPSPSENGPPRSRVPVLHRVPRALAVGAVVASCATVAALAVPAVAVPSGAATTRLLSIVDGSLTPAAVSSQVLREGGAVLATYPVADALLVSLPAGARPPAGSVVVPDVALHVASASMAATADVPGATYRSTIADPAGATGAGVTVAVVDTGVADVADLAGRVTHVNVSGDPTGDGLGHGTFLAGLVAGDGTSSGGAYTGVAPRARILDVQVAGSDGSTSLSVVLRGLQAVADAAASDRSVRVVSLALSTGDPLPPSSDPLARALDRLWSRGLTVVVAAGNDGPAAATVSSPGDDPTLITVGALDENATSSRSDDTVADYSSRGTAFGTQKPDLVAPGAHLVSTRAAGSIADVANPGSRVLDSYFTGSGTSMAEAVTAGAVAVLVATRPALTPDAIKALLVRDAYDADGLTQAAGAGAGGLDLGAAVADAYTVNLRRSSRSGSVRADATFAPDPSDSDDWAAFQAGWSAGDLDAVAAAWSRLSPQTRRWAANAFSLALLSANAGSSDADYAAVEDLAHAWATQSWSGRGWASDEWVAHAWKGADWSAHAWALSQWSAHAWKDSGWDAHAWAASYFDAHAWKDQTWSAHAWRTASWDAHAWASTDWLAFAWTAREWAAHAWASDAWDAQAFSAHAWKGDSWSAHAWRSDSWSAHAWSAHAWSAGDWTDYAFAAHAWAAHAWSSEVWMAVGWSGLGSEADAS